MNFLEILLMWLKELGELGISLVLLGINFGWIYIIYRFIKHFVSYHAQCQSEFAEQREQRHNRNQTVEDINKELDEVEASLNAVSKAGNPDSKITPIWEAKPPER